jgi:NAD(P)-dependent dehydrogenase (short-subunit alcohol dehydrogenase family)
MACGKAPGACTVADQVPGQVISDTGRIDVLVDNAGILPDGRRWKLTDEDHESVLAVPAGGTLRVTRAAIPHFRRQGSGRIIDITSCRPARHPRPVPLRHGTRRGRLHRRRRPARRRQSLAVSCPAWEAL